MPILIRHLSVITEPAVEPISLEELKLHQRLSGDSEDTLLRTLIKSARRKAEQITQRTFITTTLEVSFDEPYPPHSLELPRPDLQSVTSVTTFGTNDVGAVFDSTNYNVDTGRASRVFLTEDGTWPSALRTLSSIVIRYVSGYGNDPADVPEEVRQAIKVIAGHMYEHRDEGGTVPDLAKELLSQEVVAWL